MNITTAKTRLGPLCRKASAVGRDVLKEVAIKDGHAYATDGHIALRCGVGPYYGEYKASYDDVPHGFPLEGLNSLVDEPVSNWRRLPTDGEDWRRLTEELMSKVSAEKREAEYNVNSRYVLERCPCCGEDIYYDQDERELVEYEDIVARQDIDYRDVCIPVKVVLDGVSVLVNFAYLWAANMALGALEIGKGASRNLAIRFGDARGVIEPLREYALSGEHEPVELETEEIVQKKGGEG